MAIAENIEQAAIAHELERSDKCGRNIFDTKPQKLVCKSRPSPNNKVQEVHHYLDILSKLRHKPANAKDIVDDDRDLVTFAFQNVHMMQKYWLRLVYTSIELVL